MGAETAKEKGLEGWAYTLDYPSYSPFLKYSTNRELRKQIWMAYNTRAIGGENDNTEIVKKIVDLRIKIANILGYETYADYALENRMAKVRTVWVLSPPTGRDVPSRCPMPISKVSASVPW